MLYSTLSIFCLTALATALPQAPVASTSTAAPAPIPTGYCGVQILDFDPNDDSKDVTIDLINSDDTRAGGATLNLPNYAADEAYAHWQTLTGLRFDFNVVNAEGDLSMDYTNPYGYTVPGEGAFDWSQCAERDTIYKWGATGPGSIESGDSRYCHILCGGEGKTE